MDLSIAKPVREDLRRPVSQLTNCCASARKHCAGLWRALLRRSQSTLSRSGERALHPPFVLWRGATAMHTLGQPGSATAQSARRSLEEFYMNVPLRALRAALAYLFVAAAIFALSGCESLWRGEDPKQKKALADVVDAVQYAVDQAAADKAWLATKKELDHWTAACRAAKEGTSGACVVMQDEAAGLCRAACPSGRCDPGAEHRCQQYIKGEDVPGLCLANLPANDVRGRWCPAARTCAAKTQEQMRICSNIATLQLPALSKAELTLAVERKVEKSVELNVLLVSFGGGRSQASSNSVSMTLKPRVRDGDYGVVAMDPIPSKTVSAEAQKLASQLGELIREALAASVKEYEPGKPGIAARPPMLMSDLSITFTLVVDSNGSLGIKKAWDTPAGIEIGAGTSTKRSNSLTISYSRPE